jgi:hypothetical protein
MVLVQTDTITTVDKQQIKGAYNAALDSILNLTVLPGIAFIWLMLAINKLPPNSISYYGTDFLGYQLT